LPEADYPSGIEVEDVENGECFGDNHPLALNGRS
jgi:hypothetical protein